MRSVEMYMQVTERLRDARRRGVDVDHYVDELHALASAMDATSRKQVRERLIADEARADRAEVKRVAA